MIHLKGVSKKLGSKPKFIRKTRTSRRRGSISSLKPNSRAGLSASDCFPRTSLLGEVCCSPGSGGDTVILSNDSSSTRSTRARPNAC